MTVRGSSLLLFAEVMVMLLLATPFVWFPIATTTAMGCVLLPLHAFCVISYCHYNRKPWS